MMQKLYYKIAEHIVVIETSNSDVTEKLIPTFAPFRIDEIKNVQPLLFFSGNHKIIAPNTNPLEGIDYEGMNFKIYDVLELDGKIISMNIGSKTHSLFASNDNKTFKSDLILTDTEDALFLQFLLRAAYGMAAVHNKTIKIHASVTKKLDMAIVLLGESGTGKSTHSRLWSEFVPGSSLLNDDEPIVRLLDDGTVRVYGAPWSGSTPCYKNDSAEVAAFVHLYQSKENRLSRLNSIDSFASLFQSSAILRSDKEGRKLVFELITDILNIVPCYRLDNRPDREAVSLTESLLV